MTYLSALSAIFFTSIAQILIKKAAVSAKTAYYLLSGFFFFLAFIFSAITLRWIELKTFTMMTSLSLVFTCLLSRIYLKEKVRVKSLIGYCLIILGICIAVS